jgi:cation-transporting ATPase E
VQTKNNGCFVLGAPEFVLQKENLPKDIEDYAKKFRILVLVGSKNNFRDRNNLPEELKILAFILLKDKIRKNAERTLQYFAEQDVDIKIISGDNVLTVQKVAQSVGVKNHDKYIDMSEVEKDRDLCEISDKYTVFGRVSPEQKKDLIHSLKQNGHTVAMTGDGVNDVLALKEANCSIAMASGSSAARNVSELVLLNSNFETLPKAVLEGRRSINNIQKSASLFLIKTMYSTMLAIIFLFINMPYPFEPIQMTFISVLTIGIPAFVLALEPNKSRFKHHFLRNILNSAIPGAVTIVINIFLLNFVAGVFLNDSTINNEEISTLCVILTGFTAFLSLYRICLPFNLLRKSLFSTLVILFASTLLFPSRDILSLTGMRPFTTAVMLGLLASSFGVFLAICKICKKRNKGIEEVGGRM